MIKLTTTFRRGSFDRLRQRVGQHLDENPMTQWILYGIAILFGGAILPMKYYPHEMVTSQIREGHSVTTQMPVVAIVVCTAVLSVLLGTMFYMVLRPSQGRRISPFLDALKAGSLAATFASALTTASFATSGYEGHVDTAAFLTVGCLVAFAIAHLLERRPA